MPITLNCPVALICRKIWRSGSFRSSQAIKLLHNYYTLRQWFTDTVIFLNDPGSWQPEVPRKMSFTFHFLTQVFHPWWCETCIGLVIQQQFWVKECDILGVKIYSNPSYIVSGSQDPKSRIYAPGSELSSETAMRGIFCFFSHVIIQRCQIYHRHINVYRYHIYHISDITISWISCLICYYCFAYLMGFLSSLNNTETSAVSPVRLLRWQ